MLALASAGRGAGAAHANRCAVAPGPQLPADVEIVRLGNQIGAIGQTRVEGCSVPVAADAV